PVLLAIGLRADQQRFFRDAVRCVCLLWIAVPELALTKWHGCELRIRADRSEQNELLDGVCAALLEHVRAHHEVRVPKTTGILAIRADPADLGCEVKDEVGL